MKGERSAADVQTLAQAGRPNIQKPAWAEGYVGRASESDPLYEVTQQAFIHGKLLQPGERVRWAGVQAPYMILIDETTGERAVAKKVVAAAAAPAPTIPEIAPRPTVKPAEAPSTVEAETSPATSRRRRRKVE